MISRRRGVLVTALLGLSICLVIALVAGVESVEFEPGRVLTTGGSGVRSQKWSPEPGGASVIPGFDPFKILLPACLALIVLSTALSIRDRRLRPQLLFSLLFFAAVVLVANFALVFQRDDLEDVAQEDEQEETTDVAPRAAATQARRVEQPPPAASSGWPVVVSSILAVVLIGLVATPLVRGWFRRRRAPSSDSAAREILDIAADAAREIEAGEDPIGVVQRCYARMLRALSDRAGVDPTYRTPREFAKVLRDIGFGGENVDALTEMFELVRYGARSDALFAERAHKHLNALRLSHEAG